MSVTFTPAAGTTTTYSYYTADPEDIVASFSFGEIANGILRIATETPSINHCNSRAAGLMEILGFGSRMIHEDGSEERVLYGRIPAHRCERLISTIEKIARENYELYDEFTLDVWQQLLRHCIFHDCDVIYG